MGGRGTVRPRMLVIGAAASVAMVLGVGSAAAAPGLAMPAAAASGQIAMAAGSTAAPSEDPPPAWYWEKTSYFTRNTRVLAESPDGRLCHWGMGCAPGNAELEASPWRYQRYDEIDRVLCREGNFVQVRPSYNGPKVWAPRDAVWSDKTVDQCDVVFGWD